MYQKKISYELLTFRFILLIVLRAKIIMKVDLCKKYYRVQQGIGNFKISGVSL